MAFSGFQVALTEEFVAEKRIQELYAGESTQAYKGLLACLVPVLPYMGIDMVNNTGSGVVKVLKAVEMAPEVVEVAILEDLCSML